MFAAVMFTVPVVTLIALPAFAVTVGVVGAAVPAPTLNWSVPPFRVIPLGLPSAFGPVTSNVPPELTFAAPVPTELVDGPRASSVPALTFVAPE